MKQTKQYIENMPIIYLMIVLFCMNLLGRGSIVCLACGLLSLLLINKHLRFDRTALLLLIFTVLSALASFMFESAMEAVKCLNFVIMYLVGSNALRIARDKDTFIRRAIFSMFLGYFLLVALTYFSNLDDVSVSGQRLIRNFWTGEYVSVTIVGLLSSVVIGYFFYAVISGRAWLRIVGVASIAVVFLVNSMTATRTPIILFAILALVMSAVYIFTSRRSSARPFLFILLILAVLGVLYATDTFGIRTVVESTPIYKRFEAEGTQTDRFAVAREYLSIMLDHPFGGSAAYARIGVLAHNFLQQGYDLYGLPAGVILLLLLVLFARNVLTLIRRVDKRPVDYLLISMYIAMIIQAFLEPIFTGYPCFFFSLLFMHGMTNEYLRHADEVS